MIKQKARCEGGPHAGGIATMRFPLPFFRGMKINVHGHVYVVRNDAISESIEKTQQPIKHGCILLRSWDVMDEEERQQLAEFLKENATTPSEETKAEVE